MDGMGTDVQYRILRAISSDEETCRAGKAYESKSKLAILLGQEFLSRVPGKTIVNFGCGTGDEAIELARIGAKRVVVLTFVMTSSEEQEIKRTHGSP
jgi:ubiquinone/menaquinone biosynthesis C-methylase UbiE